MNILGLNREFIKAFDTFSDAYIEKEINLVPTLNFTIISDLGKYFKEEYYIQIEGYGEYILKEKKKSSGKYDIVCKPNLDDFQNEFYPNYTYTTNTITNILQPLLDPIGWTIECNDERVETLTGKDKTLLEIILHGMELFEYEYIWDIPNKRILCGPTVGEDKGSYLHQEVNLRELNITTHSYDLVTRLIPKGKDDLGIEGVNNGVRYLEPTEKYTNKIVYGVWRDERYTIPENLKAAGQKLIDSIGKVYKSYEVDVIDLARLSNKYSYLSYDIGDTITLVDRENETYSKERVVAKKEYLREKLKDSVTLSNAPLSINQVQDKLNKNLENEISVTRQYITVLEGEIKSKVSTETYNELETRVKTAEEKITDEAITLKVSKSVETYLTENPVEGTAGKSAYEIALEKGFQGTEEEWLASIDGKDGYTPIKGVDYFDGEKGDPGKGIKTRLIYYKVTTENVAPSNTYNTGWTTTPPVPNEANPYLWAFEETTYTDNTSSKTAVVLFGMYSKPGDSGSDGKTAYQLAVEQGYQGTVEEWLKSLAGKDAAFKGTEPPTDTNLLWFDENTNKLKFFDGTEWREMDEELLNKIEEIEQVQITNATNIQLLSDSIDLTNKKITEGVLITEELSTTVSILNDRVNQEFERISSEVTANGEEVRKITGLIGSGMDEEGNVYTEWKSGENASVRVGTDSIRMISAGEETFKVQDGNAHATSLYVQNEIGFGNHTAKKYGTEFTIFSWTGGNQ